MTDGPRPAIVYERLSFGWSVHCSRCKRGEAGSRRQILLWADRHECVL